MKSATSSYTFLVPPATSTRGGVTAFVTESLRRAIVTLELQPGESLDKAGICKRLNVSRFPVSEALARLQTEGLVDILPQRGSRVSLVRIAEVREYMLIRKALESEAVRVLVGLHSQTLIAQLRDNLALQRRASEENNRVGFHEADLAFHDMLFTGMGFSKLKAVIDSARANLDRARRLIISPRRLAFSLAEHQAIFEALDGGDAANAVKGMRAHIDSVMVELFAFARVHPDLFADGSDNLADRPDDFPFG